MPGGHRNPRIGPLDTMSGVRRECAKLYRQARRGDLDIQDATRLVHILRTIGELLASEVIERRIDGLEAHAKITAGHMGIRELTLIKRQAG